MNFKDFSVGADIENIVRFRKLDKKTDKIFLHKILTNKELKYCFSKNDPAPHIAGRFSAKESVVKALGALGENGLQFNEMEILNDENNVPKVFFKDKRLKKYKVKLTISHAKDKALGVAVVIKV